MLGKKSDSEIELKCTEQAIPEFPDLLFGKQIETGALYCDATDYLNKKDPKKSVKMFFEEFKHVINRMCNSYEMKFNDVCKINENGHYLIDSNFCYLFLSYVEPNLLAYIFDRIQELFNQGLVVSDSYLARAAKQRLPKELLLKLSEDDGEVNS